MPEKTNVMTKSVEELTNNVRTLNYEIKKILENYHSFYCDMTWSRYGEVVMLKSAIPELTKHLGELSKRIEKGVEK